MAYKTAISSRASPSAMKNPGLVIQTSGLDITLHPPRTKIGKRTPRSTDLEKFLQTSPRPTDTYLELVRNAVKRNNKLDRILGGRDARHPRIDSCTIPQAFEHGLAGCLSSKRVLTYFLHYLLEVRDDLLIVLIDRKTLLKNYCSCSKLNTLNNFHTSHSQKGPVMHLQFLMRIYIQRVSCISTLSHRLCEE
jgi:hypothetical protein